MIAAAVAVGCVDDQPDAYLTHSPAEASIGANSASGSPTIGGTPPKSVMQGTLFEFVPTAADRENDRLSFSIANRPPWATFNAVTGRLHGTPGPGDVGAYTNVTIRVSDGVSTASLQPFDIQVVGTATGTATLSWMPPLQRTNGTALTNLAGYKVYWGTKPESFSASVRIDNPGLTLYVIDGLTPATWYFVVTAFDSKGVESEFSNVASKKIL